MNTQVSIIFRRLSLSIVRVFVLVVVVWGTALPACATDSTGAPAETGLKPILDYISSAWDTLTRSMTDCQSVVDPKIKVAPVLYLPAGFEEPEAVKKLSTDCSVHIEPLPQPIHRLGEIDTSKIQPHGLLFLPDKY